MLEQAGAAAAGELGGAAAAQRMHVLKNTGARVCMTVPCMHWPSEARAPQDPSSIFWSLLSPRRVWVRRACSARWRSTQEI